MHNLRLIYEYRNHDVYRRSLDQLLVDFLGKGTIERWYQAGWWNADDFWCHAYVEDQTVVANISGYNLSILSEGQRFSALQLCCVATHPSYRRQGLCEDLTKRFIKMYLSQFDILYAVTVHKAMEHTLLKQDFTIQTQREYFFTPPPRSMTLSPTTSRKHKLDLDDEVEAQLLLRFAKERIPVSRAFHVENAHHLLLLWCLGPFKDHIYFLPDDDSIAIAKRENGVLHIYDILFQREVSLSSIVDKFLDDEQEVHEGLFYFTPPEWSDIPIQSRVLQCSEGFLTRPFLPSLEACRYPILG